MKLFDKTMKLFSLLCLLMIIGTISCVDKGVVRLVVRVGEDVVLPCSLGPEVDIERAAFDWMKGRQEVFVYDAGYYRTGDPQFKERVSHFPDKLNHGNASIIIRNIQLSDSGYYSCILRRLQQQRFHVELVVGIYAEPRVMILEITEDWALLQCEVRGASPKPQISWIDSDGTVLPAEEKLEDSDDLRYPPTLMLQTTVTKTGIFSCRVIQQELNFTTEVQIFVLIFNDETVTGSNGVLLGVAIVGWILFALCLVVDGIYCWKRRKAKRAKMLNDFISPKNEQFTMVSAHHVIQPTTQKPHPSLEEEDVSHLFLPQPVDNQDCLDHSPLLGHSRDQPGPPVSSSPSVHLPARKIPDSDDSSLSSSRAPESRDSGVSFRYSSHDPEKLIAIISCKDKRPAVAKPEETREPTPELEPDEAVRIPMEEL